jgi:beta-glucanase (GH16 family)
LSATPPPSSESPPGPQRAGWRLVWADEFDGEALDRERWEPELGSGFNDPVTGAWVPGWGNNELQTYTEAPSNLCVRDGCLVIRALAEPQEGAAYTSARLRTRRADGTTLFSQAYGRFECRCRMTAGQGLWPAFWLLPSEAHYGGWAASGEIDVMEVVGARPHEVLGSLHFGGPWPARDHRTVVHAFPPGDSAERFHVYAVEWDPGVIRWYVDDTLYAEQRFWWSSSRRDEAGGLAPRDAADLNPWPAPFDRPFHLLLNLAVGGGLPGPPDETTPFPAELAVDYVRVYARRDGMGCRCSRAPQRVRCRIPLPADRSAGDDHATRRARSAGPTVHR